MKIFNRKLNNKGFTLIELLAVIVILALVMVVTIPTVLGTMNSARNDTFKNSVNSIASWVERQYELAYNGVGGYSSAFTNVCTPALNYCGSQLTMTASTPTAANFKAFIKAAGGDPANFTQNGSSIKVSNGRACVKLKGASGGAFKSTSTVSSSAC